MKVVDIIFSLICGRVIGLLLGDFLEEWGIHIGWQYQLLIWVVLPFFALFCLWIFYHLGRRMLFFFQGAKFLLVGAVATVIDLKVFEWSLWILSLIVLIDPLALNLALKGISFLLATVIKFWGNKYWAFAKHEKDNIHKEAMYFFCITLIGLIIDVTVFYYCTRVLGPQFELSAAIWLKSSVIFAALAAALWNFIGYKHFVFRK